MGSRELRTVASNREPQSEGTEAFFREDAERLGLTYHEYCKRYGIIGPSQDRRIRRHEVPLEE